jgi:hypothetical protein
MSKQDRQRRYRTTGAAAELVKVETLVPAEGREEVLRLAARLRRRFRRGRTVEAARPLDVDAIIGKLRELCTLQPRRYAGASDIDRVTEVSVNVPFPRRIDAETIARALMDDAIPDGYCGHLERFLGETPLNSILRFCDRHGIAASRLAGFVAKHREDLALHRPDLEEHLYAVSGT